MLESAAVKAYLRKGTIVPEVALVRETVANVSKLALLDILLDRVKEFFLGDLQDKKRHLVSIERQK